jgi:hypothetical protein
MKTTVANSTSTLSISAASLTLITAAVALLFLLSLHFLSPEFDPSWRMVSEYANGNYGWVLSLMFATWALSSWLLAVTLWPQVSTTAGKVGLGFLVLAGIGEAMAAVFDITHPLHGLSGFIGIGCLPIAALLISYSLTRRPDWSPAKKPLLLTAHLTWVSVVLMAATFILLIVTFMQSGGDMTAASTEITTLPAGVIALVGWANRLLIVVYCAWVITAAWGAIQAKRNK